MKSYRYLLFGGGIMFLAACFSLLFSIPYHAVADYQCISGNCYVTDTTLSDFVQGSFSFTGLSNVGDGGVQLIPMGITSQWVTDTYRIGSSTPNGSGFIRKELAAVIYKDIIYVIGGIDGSNAKRSEIYSATTYITGPIKPPGFVQVTTLPTALSGMAAVISTTASGGFLYIVGGSTGTPQSTISYRSFNLNGAFTSGWTTVNVLDVSAVYASAVVRNGNLYVIGGYDGAYDDSWMYRFPINSDGSLPTREDYVDALPTGRHSFGATTWTDESGIDHLYVAGGESGYDITYRRYISVPRTIFGDTDPTVPLVEHSGDGLQNTLAEHGAVQKSGGIFLTGGLEGSINDPKDTVYTALIDPDGALHNWGLGSPWLSSNPLPRPRRYHATVMNSGGEVYVIGGYGVNRDGLDDSSGADTIYHGPTTGVGSRYAPAGRYLSRVVNLIQETGAQRPINQIVVNTTITSPVTMTVQYRYSNDVGGLQSAPWNDLPSLTYGISVPNTFAVTPFTAGVLQYRAYFTSPNPYNLSPILNSFQLRFPEPPTPTPTNTATTSPYTPTPTFTPVAVISPDLTILGIASAPVGAITGYHTMTIRVANIGNQAFSPMRLVPAPPSKVPQLPPPAFRSTQRQPGSARAPGAYFAWISPYIDRAPLGVNDLGNCNDEFGALRTPPYVYMGDLPIGTYRDYNTQCWLTPVTHTFYAQVDTCDNPPTCSISTGYVLERIETNNIFGPVSSGSIITQTLGGNYFPYIRKNQ